MNIIDRLKEPSTQAGLAGLLGAATAFGVPLTTVQAISTAAGAVLSLLAIFMPEKS